MKKNDYLFIAGTIFSLMLMSCGPKTELQTVSQADSRNVSQTDSWNISQTGDVKEESSSREGDTGQAETIVPEIANNTGKTTGKETENTAEPEREKIENQTFRVELRPLGKVIFSSYAPDISKNPMADAVFEIEQDGKLLQTLPGLSEDNCRENEYLNEVEAVSFPDYNEDGYDDIIVICRYSSASGPDAGQEHSEVRFYKGSADGTFLYEEQMSSDASSALAVVTVQSALDFIGAGERKRVPIEPWQAAYIRYLQTESVVEGQEGYALIYLDGDEIPELVEVGNCEASGCRIINFSDEKTHVTQLDRLYFSYIENENLLCNSDGLMDHYYDLVYRIIDGKMTLIAEGDYGVEDNSALQFDEEGNPVYQYEWNGKEVSRDAYDTELNRIYDTSRAKIGYEWDALYSMEEMAALLDHFQR